MITDGCAVDDSDSNTLWQRCYLCPSLEVYKREVRFEELVNNTQRPLSRNNFRNKATNHILSFQSLANVAITGVRAIDHIYIETLGPFRFYLHSCIRAARCGAVDCEIALHAGWSRV